MKRLDPIAVGLALTPLLATLLTITTYEWSDNGLFLAAAERVRQGDAPYRDFFWFYLPGAPYLLGALEKIFGQHYLVIRGFFTATTFATYLMTVRLIRILFHGRQGWGLVSAIVLLSWGSWRAILNHNVLVPTAGLATILLAIGALDDARARRLLWVGVPAALVMVFNHLGGALLCIGTALSFPAARFASGAPGAFAVRRWLRESLLVWAAPAAMLALVVVVGAVRGGNRQMLDAAFFRLLTRYVSHEPGRGGIFELRSALEGEAKFNLLSGSIAHVVRVARLLIAAVAVRFLPLLAMAAGVGLLLHDRRRSASSPAAGPFAVTLVIGSFLFLEAFKGWRPDRASLASLPLLIAFWCAVGRAPRALRLGSYLAGVALALATASFSVGTVAYILRTWRTMPLVETRLGKLRSMTVEDARASSALMTAIRARNARTLFAYYYQPSLYPLTGLQPTTQYQFFTTILFTREQLEGVCDDLRRAPADLVVRDADWDLRGPGLPDTLDRCVHELYVEDERVEGSLPGHPFILMHRK